MVQVIVVNGGSSSGKSGIIRCLQAMLPDPWLAFETDTLIQAMPPSNTGIEFTAGGGVAVGAQFRAPATREAAHADRRSRDCGPRYIHSGRSRLLRYLVLYGATLNGRLDASSARLRCNL